MRVTLHMVMSVDGIVAKPDNSVDWFETKDHYPQGADEPDLTEFFNTIDCYVMGAVTYEHALKLSETHGWPYGDVPTYVTTSRDLPTLRPNVHLWKGDLHTLLDSELRPRYRNVWVVGGTKLVSALMQLGLADELRIVVLPIVLGQGRTFFEGLTQEWPLHLTDAKAYKNGMVELCYEVRR